MNIRNRKLTVVGLGAREELLVRSLLKMVNAKTTEPWMFHEGLEANVALCKPDSAMTLMAVRRANANGMVCVSVVHEGEPSLPETLTLRAPIRSGEFIDVLNQASEQLQVHGRVRRPAVVEERQESLALALRRLSLQGAHSHVRVHINGHVFIADLKRHRLGSEDTLTDDDLVALGQVRAFLVDGADTTAGEIEMARAGCVTRLDRLWWLVGIQAARDGSTDVLPDRPYQLRRWPDAGRLPLQSFQLRMAAMLMRQAMTSVELAAKVQRPLNDAHAFVSGCHMLGLLQEPDVASVVPVVAPSVVPARASRYGDLFQSLRTKLGIRG